MAIGVTVIGTADFGATPESQFFSPSYNQAAGHCIVIALETYTPAGAAVLSDTAGNTYTAVFPDNSGKGPVSSATYVQMFYCPNCLGNVANIIKILQTNSGFSFAIFYDLSGADLVSPLAAQAEGSGTNASPVTVAFSTARASTIAIALVGSGTGISNPGFTAGSGYTLDYNQENFVGAVEHQIFSSAQTGITAGMGASASDPWVMVVAAFQAPAGGSGGGPGTGAPPFGWVNTQGDHYNKRGLR